MQDSISHSHIFTNKNGNTLMREFEGVLSNNPTIKNLDAVVGFLRASGYFTLRPFLDNINKARVLVGINVDKYIVEAARQGKIFFGAEDEVKEDCLRQVRYDIEHAGYKEEIEQGIFQMVKDLNDGKLEFRAHPSKRIHAKIYVQIRAVPKIVWSVTLISPIPYFVPILVKMSLYSWVFINIYARKFTSYAIMGVDKPKICPVVAIPLYVAASQNRSNKFIRSFAFII